MQSWLNKVTRREREGVWERDAILMSYSFTTCATSTGVFVFVTAQFADDGCEDSQKCQWVFVVVFLLISVWALDKNQD